MVPNIRTQSYFFSRNRPCVFHLGALWNVRYTQVTHFIFASGKKKSKMCFHLLNATFAQLQHGQVVVSFSVVVIKRQRKFETLIGQRQVCYAL